MTQERTPETLWQEALSILRTRLGDQPFETWFQGTKAVAMGPKGLTVLVPSQFYKDWIQDKYQRDVQEALQQAASEILDIEYQIALPAHVSRAVSKTPPPLSKQPVGSGESALNPRYRFDTFVVGPSNRFAQAASLAVAENPARAYNPLFIYGGVGLGKTHLMQAIGHFLLKKDGRTKVLYISSELFTNQLIGAIQNRTTLQFRQKFRGVDVLLIDDIQFIAGKEATQEEFFHTFNTLYDAHKQIVISSDRSPREIAGLEERLVSRFAWGLVTDIQKPDLETRIAILSKRAEADRLAVPQEVTFFIAEKISSNIRELEGAFMRVVAYSSFFDKSISIDLAKEVLKEMFLEEEKKITVDHIQKKVAEYFDIRLQDMAAKRRSRAVVYPRQVAMYLVRELTGHSLPEIGEFFGGRDHTTVLHAHQKIRQDMEQSEQVRGLVQKLIHKIRT